ncbi:hypothetical protein ACIQU6_38635 [Streptomyces sp. NPDC090442]|uniref:hypothetical protein n=1 Tax=Streptomyces sp. NPDC090442 TaxID=3365962 RepID=UPI0038112101
MTSLKKTRIFAISAALSIALATGSITAASASAAPHTIAKAKATVAKTTLHGHDDDGDCKGLLVLLCA